jgi:hypothetical protein
MALVHRWAYQRALWTVWGVDGLEVSLPGPSLLVAQVHEWTAWVQLVS